MESHPEDGTYDIIGCAINVQRELGFGLREKPYEKALLIELRDSGFDAFSQKMFPILYKGLPVGDCIPDIVLPDLRILLEIKAIESIGDREASQVLNYLRITQYRLGLIINFGTKVQCKRVVLG